jgi:MFS family permease
MERGWLSGSLRPLPLLALAVGALIFTHDFGAIGNVVPEIQDHFSAGLGSVQWAITGFSIAIALAVIPAGRLADVYGADRTFVAGALGFALASALVAAAPALWFLLAARALEGVAAGFVWISAIALIFRHYGESRAAAAGALAVVLSGVGLALGPFDAGVLIEWIGWRAAFAFNIPFALFAAVVIARNPLERAPTSDRSIDWTGVGLLAGALVALLVTLRYAPEWGWGSAGTVAGFLVALAFFAAFGAQQRAWGERALVPPDLARNRALMVTLVAEALLGSSYFVAISFAPQVFANVLGANAIESGLMQMPTMAAFAVGGIVGAAILARVPATIVAVGAGAVALLGGLVMALMADDPGYLGLLPGLVLIGGGSGALFGALLTLGVGAIADARKGLAGGLLYTAQLAGGAIVLAAATAVATQAETGAGKGAAEAAVDGARSAFGFGVVVAIVGLAAVAWGFGVRRRSAEARTEAGPEA